MAVADHRKATEAMLRMRDLLLDSDEPVAGDVKMSLTCAGIAMQRRVLMADDTVPAVQAQIATTMALLFVLVVLCNGNPPRPSGAGSSDDGCMDCDLEDDQEERDDSIAIAAWESTSIMSEIAAADGAAADGWTAVLRSPGSLCQTCLVTAARRSHEMTLGELANMGALFFRTSARALAVSLFDRAGHPADDGSAFLTLDTVGFMAQANNNLDERLLSITDCAESEAGQQVRSTYLEPFLPLRTHAYFPPEAQCDAVLLSEELLYPFAGAPGLDPQLQAAALGGGRAPHQLARARLQQEGDREAHQCAGRRARRCYARGQVEL
tara:strand:+ start:153 stop:1121 length:969 start_codon:yes stop_codon:yes gene_type:complete